MQLSGWRDRAWQMLQLSPGAEVRLVDTDLTYTTKQGNDVKYIKVQLDPPYGPIGFVASNYLDYQHPKKLKDIEHVERKRVV